MFTLKFLRNSLLSGVNSSRIVGSRSISLFKRPRETKPDKDDEDLFEEPEPEKFAFVDEEELDPELENERIAKIRNKSRLRPAHRNMLFGNKPYQQAESWIHTTLKYKRMQYGRLGNESGVDPRICFYTASELAEKDEFERIGHPKTIQELIAINEAKKKEEKEKLRAREEQITLNIKKLEQWKSDFTSKRDKKEEEGMILSSLVNFNLTISIFSSSCR